MTLDGNLATARLREGAPRWCRGRERDELEQIRQHGYALLDSELEEELFVIGCPVRDAAGALIGILTVNGPTQRLKSDQLPQIIETALQAADDISKALI